MRFIHTADLHLDSPMTAHLRAQDHLTRRAEVGDALRRLLEDGLSRNGEGVLIVGDLFDSEYAMPYTVDAMLGLIKSYAPLPVFYVAGNHEGDALSRRAELPDNLHILSTHTPPVRLPQGICLYGASSPADLCKLPLDPEAYNIVLLHAAIGERTDESTLRLSDIAEFPIDYLALGHYHSFTEYRAGERILAAYSGTPEGRGYDECGAKGYALLDTETRQVSFIGTARRRIFDLSIDISAAQGETDIPPLMERALTEQGVRSQDMVRLTLTGQVPAGLRRDIIALSARFEGRFFSFALRERCQLRLCKDDIAADPTLKGEFIRTVMADTTLTEQQRDRIIDCGLRYLSEGGGRR